MIFVIVNPFSPRWNNIASVRTEKLAKYISRKYETLLVTSSFSDELSQKSWRRYDIGSAKLIEIPLRYWKRSPETRKVSVERNKTSLFKKIYQYLKPNVWYLLEISSSISSGGILIHDFRQYEKKLSEIILNYPHEKVVLFTSYGPDFVLRLGKKLKERFPNIIWVADFRDPAFNIFDTLISRSQLFEKRVFKICRTADAITTVFEAFGSADSYQKFGNKLYFIPNGYDPEDYIELSDDLVRINTYNFSSFFTIAFTGSVYKDRSLEPFVQALSLVKDKNKSSEITFVHCGKDSQEIALLMKKYGLEECSKGFGFVSREQSQKIQLESDILVLPFYTGKNKNFGAIIRTGKVYEYLMSGKPILAIGPQEWKMREEIEADGVSKVFEKNEIEAMGEYILRLKEMKEKGQLPNLVERRKHILEEYRYDKIVEKLLDAVEKALKNRGE